MVKCIDKENERLNTERMIHAAIRGYRIRDFYFAFAMGVAAISRIPKPPNSARHLALLSEVATLRPTPDEVKGYFNRGKEWTWNAGEAVDEDYDDIAVSLLLIEAVAKYVSAYGDGTPLMTDLFPWARNASVH